jgi:hypothetical protein
MSVDLPRYVRKVVRRDDTFYYKYDPPKKFIDAGLVTRQRPIPNLGAAREIGEESNAKIDAWKKVYDIRRGDMGKATVHQLIVQYKLTPPYRRLGVQSKEEYVFGFNNIERIMGNKKIGSLNVLHAKGFYKQWLERGPHTASKLCKIGNVLFNFAMDQGYIPMNPFSRVVKQKTQKRSVVWTDEQVRAFLAAAYSDFKWRSIGLLAHMTYTWVQRVCDIRMLTWDAIDFASQTVTIKSTSRRNTVFIPIEGGLLCVLRQQQNDFGFQPYVVPRVKPRLGKFHPYNGDQVGSMTRDILKVANLPSRLRLSDLRRTGTIQMIDGGVPVTTLMQVTGHAHVASLEPYLRNTLAGAGEALKKRLI